jgi:hypothetical protein
MRLNPSQVRAVSVTLQLTEEAIEAIERLLSAHSTGATHRPIDDLIPEEREQIRTRCGQAREALGTAAARVGAEIAGHPLRREIRAQAAATWVTLQDTKSDALRGYGPLSSEDAVAVDDLLEAISRHVTAIFRLVETARGEGTRTPPTVKAGPQRRR